jgi:hypothetical protein
LAARKNKGLPLEHSYSCINGIHWSELIPLRETKNTTIQFSPRKQHHQRRRRKMIIGTHKTFLKTMQVEIQAALYRSITPATIRLPLLPLTVHMTSMGGSFQVEVPVAVGSRGLVMDIKEAMKARTQPMTPRKGALLIIIPGIAIVEVETQVTAVEEGNNLPIYVQGDHILPDLYDEEKPLD